MSEKSKRSILAFLRKLWKKDINTDLKNKKWSLGFKIGLGFLVFWAVIQSIDIDQFLNLVKDANLFYLLLCGLLLNVDRFFMAFKWGLLLNHKKPGSAAFFPLVKSYYLSSIVSSIVPPTIGEDIVRGLSVSRAGMNTESVLSSIFAERIFGTLSMFILVATTLTLLTWRYPQIDHILLYSAITLAAILILMIIVSFCLPLGRFMQAIPFLKSRTKFVSMINKAYTAYQAYRHSKKQITLFVLLSIVENCFVVVGIYWIALAIDVNVKWVDMLLTVPAITLFSKIPITFGGLGVQEGIFVSFLSLIGVPPTHAFTISILGRAINIVAVLPVFMLLYFLGLNRSELSNSHISE